MEKFCFACGQKLPQSAKFCTSCGQKQPVITEEPNVVEKASQPSSVQVETEPVQLTADSATAPETSNLQDEVNQSVKNQSAKDVGLGILTKSFLDVGPLMKTANVVQKKVELGYSDDPSNFVYIATPMDWKQILSVGGLTGMASQNYVMSFEPAGILLMGCIGLAKFNDDNHFISNADIDKIDLEKPVFGAEWDHMFLEIKGESLELLVQHPTLSPIIWHRQNFKKNLTYTV